MASARGASNASGRTAARGKSFRLLPAGAVSFLRERLIEALGLSLVLLGFVLVIVCLGYDPADPSLNRAGAQEIGNPLGLLGAYTADLLLQSFGLGAFLVAFLPIAWGWRLLRSHAISRFTLRLLAAVVALMAATLALTVVPATQGWPLRSGLGGWLGLLLLSQALRLFAVSPVIPALLAGVFALGLGVFALAFRLGEWRAVGRGVGRGSSRALGYLRSGVGRSASLLNRRRPADVQEGDTEAQKPARPAPARRQRKPAKSTAPASPAASASESAPSLVAEPSQRPKAPRRERGDEQTSLAFSDGGYEPPPLTLLTEPTKDGGQLDRDGLEKNARLLEGVLQDFGVRGEIVKVRPGPVVTRYDLEPAPGTKTSRVVALSDDIARSMSTTSVRVAVVPGTSTIGIELPNRKRETVYLRELLASSDYIESKAALPLVLGKDIGGLPISVDLARMPHLLIAGTTGSGKSVGINAMILSLLYRLPPERCRMIMVDPKMLELSVYDGIPHLLTPVVTEPKKAVVALKWAVREMENRYRAMSLLGVRNIDGYNARLEEARRSGEVLTRRVQTGFDPDTGQPIHEEEPFDLEPLPYVVVVVDEMADLMLVAGKEVEGAIQRLAQMARAAGIHLIMATQRPSVDVITGTIKANFPTRISFHVTSKIDSRTILGESGAEHLLGQGDMLHMAHGGRLTRVHGPFVSDQEVEAVVAHLKAQGQPSFVEGLTDEPEGEEEGIPGLGGGEGGPDEELYRRAVEVVARHRKASTSFIQRQLQIGYNRAARLVEQMEAEGIVSAANHVGKREVLLGERGFD
ncbi:DNA translocase FtsK [Aquibaculum arenosum]|uniref:DNA translocase FtsK n=1 Tax=Aquibaculum arenosum TaxID=3032591 RepID=A0ABT5YPA4_9PROT|nr:DNA translocase FtsK [Fodinicurvata sp. CAU 1616]MDF2096795.1 DNA translocase FtsK 4TM domain-containing protein [Fodinicurvata sp. CAU 1616]